MLLVLVAVEVVGWWLVVIRSQHTCKSCPKHGSPDTAAMSAWASERVRSEWLSG